MKSYLYSVHKTENVNVQALQLRWANWSVVDEFLGDMRYFGGGVWLDDTTFAPLPQGKTSSTIGMYIHTIQGRLLVRQNDYMVKWPDGSITVMSKELFAIVFQDEPIEQVYAEKTVTDNSGLFPNL